MEPWTGVFRGGHVQSLGVFLALVIERVGGPHLGGLGERWTRDPHSFDLGFLARYHDLWSEACPDPFITSTGFFDRLAGTGTLRAALAQPEGLCDLAEGWMDPLAQYDALRQRYLAYPMQR